MFARFLNTTLCLPDAVHGFAHMASHVHPCTQTESPRARFGHPVTTPHSPVQFGTERLWFKTLHDSEKGLGPSQRCVISWQNADAQVLSGISLLLSSQLHIEGAGSGPRRHCASILEWESQNAPTQGCFYTSPQFSVIREPVKLKSLITGRWQGEINALEP